MVDSVDMCFCCGATELGDFGGGELWDNEEAECFTTKELIVQIKQQLNPAKRLGKSVVYATTTSNQPNAVAALVKLGFYTSPPFKINGDSTREMQAWFLPLTEYKGK